MLSFPLLIPLFLTPSVAYITKSKQAPSEYKKGYATQDKEPLGQKSICQTNCGLSGDNYGTGDMAPGVYAAAINPQMGGGADSCTPCGSCYSIINSGSPYCESGEQGCPVASGPSDQSGPQSIKIMIVNHCTDCSVVAGHFDINYSPGWDNPEIWWKQLPDRECRGSGGSSSSLDSVLDGGAINVDGNTTTLMPVKEAAKANPSQNGLLQNGGSATNVDNNTTALMPVKEAANANPSPLNGLLSQNGGNTGAGGNSRAPAPVAKARKGNCRRRAH